MRFDSVSLICFPYEKKYYEWQVNCMAIIKHIKSRNANYSDALEYLLFQHNEKTGKPILDDSGRKLLREEFYMDGLHCDPMSFDKECEKTNTFFHKNQKRGISKATITSSVLILLFL